MPATRIKTTSITTRTTRFIRRRLDCNVDVLSVHADGVSWERHHRGQGQRLTGAHIEGRAMPRTYDPRAFEFALIESAAVVGADVLKRIDFTADVAQQHLCSVDDEAMRLAFADLALLSDEFFGHAPLVASVL